MSFTILQPDGYFTTGVHPIFVEADRFCSDCGRRHDFEKCPRCGAWIEIQYGIGGLRFWCSREGCTWGFVRHDSDRSADLTCIHGRAPFAAPTPPENKEDPTP